MTYPFPSIYPHTARRAGGAPRLLPSDTLMTCSLPTSVSYLSHVCMYVCMYVILCVNLQRVARRTGDCSSFIVCVCVLSRGNTPPIVSSNFLPFLLWDRLSRYVESYIVDSVDAISTTTTIIPTRFILKLHTPHYTHTHIECTSD